MNNIIFEQTENGTRAEIRGPWQEWMLGPLADSNVVELELNQAKGWMGEDLKFLAVVPELRRLYVTDFRIKSVQSVMSLRHLAELKLMTYDKTQLDFSCFPELRRCILEWRPGSDSIFSCESLFSLYINNYKNKDVNKFTKLKKLQVLAIMNSSICDVEGLSALLELSSLRLANIPKLKTIEPVSSLRELISLDINTCKNIRSIAPIRYLSKLRDLIISNCGDIDSLKPIEYLDKLEMVVFPESTNILDGDLSMLTKKSRLKRSAFKNRKHYSHTHEQIQEFWHE
jgi:hypothetical protein